MLRTHSQHFGNDGVIDDGDTMFRPQGIHERLAIRRWDLETEMERPRARQREDFHEILQQNLEVFGRLRNEKGIWVRFGLPTIALDVIKTPHARIHSAVQFGRVTPWLNVDPAPGRNGTLLWQKVGKFRK